MKKVSFRSVGVLAPILLFAATGCGKKGDPEPVTYYRVSAPFTQMGYTPGAIWLNGWDASTGEAVHLLYDRNVGRQQNDTLDDQTLTDFMKAHQPSADLRVAATLEGDGSGELRVGLICRGKVTAYLPATKFRFYALSSNAAPQDTALGGECDIYEISIMEGPNL